MLIKVQKAEQGLVIPITAEIASSLDLTEGTEVEVLPVIATSRHATLQQALEAFERTLPEHENAYRTLAK